MLIISGAEQKTLIKVSLYQSSLCFAFLYKLNKKCRRKVGGKLRIPGLRRICKKEDEKMSIIANVFTKIE